MVTLDVVLLLEDVRFLTLVAPASGRIERCCEKSSNLDSCPVHVVDDGDSPCLKTVRLDYRVELGERLSHQVA